MAISFVGAADLGNNGSSVNPYNANYTCGAGANRLLVAHFAGDGVLGLDDISGVTYNSVAMTLSRKNGGGNRWLYQYFLLNPASGTNVLSVTMSTGGHYILLGAADYAGGQQSGQPDATAIDSAGAVGLTTSITTILDNCWVMMSTDGYDGNNPPAAGTGSTRRAFDGVFGTWGAFDTNSVVHPAGVKTMSWAYPNSNNVSDILTSYAPAGGAAASLFRRSVLDGLTISGPKNFNPLAS